MTASVETKKWPLGSLVMLSSTLAMAVTTEMLPMGLLPVMSRDLGASESTTGLLVTAYGFVVAMAAIPLTRFTTSWPRRKLFVGVLGTYVLSNTMMALAQEYWIAAIARAVGGLGHALFFSIVGAFAARLVSPDRVGRAIAIVWAGGSVAFTLGVPLGTALGTAVGWRGAFAILAGLAAAQAAAALSLLPILAGGSRSAASLSRVWRLPGMRAVGLTIGISMLGQYTLYTYISPLLQRSGLGEEGVSPVLFAYGAAGVIGAWISGVLADRRPRAALLGGFSVLIVALAGLIVWGTSIFPTVLTTIVWGVAFGVLPGLFQAAALRAAPAAPDTGSAIYNTAFNLGIGGGALIGGQAMDLFGLVWLIPIALTLMVIGTVVAGRNQAAFPSVLTHH